MTTKSITCKNCLARATEKDKLLKLCRVHHSKNNLELHIDMRILRSFICKFLILNLCPVMNFFYMWPYVNYKTLRSTPERNTKPFYFSRLVRSNHQHTGKLLTNISNSEVLGSYSVHYVINLGCVPASADLK